MTEPTFDPANLLVSVRELETWTQQPAGSLDDDIFALGILWGTTVLVRDAGVSGWTAATIPDAAKLIAIVVAKNYYEHPTGEISEGVSVLNSRYIDAVVHNMELTPTQLEVLQRLAAEEGNPGAGGSPFGTLQTITTTRGPLETRRRRRGTLFLRDELGNAIAMADTTDLVAMYAMTDPD